jgi:hypothetical protein
MTKPILKAHNRLAIAKTCRILCCIIPKRGPVPTLVHLSVASHPIAMTIERSVVRVAYNVLAEGVKAMQGMMRGERRKLLAL